MKLLRIRLRNFRQFYGEQTIDLAQDKKKNVTVIHAENGVGKTTLLNAVLWTLFGTTTKKFEQREKIINFTAVDEGATSAYVELTFEHDNARYLATRTHTVTAGGYQKPRFEVLKYSDRNGSLGPPLPNPEAFVNTVVPHAMAPYFFFDGEQAETFSSEANNKMVAAAIRDILGCTIIETAMGDLDYVSRQFGKLLGDLPGETEIRTREKQIEAAQEHIDRRNEELAQLDANVASLQQQVADIDEKLRGAREAADLQRQRDDRSRELASVQQSLADVRNDLLKWLSSKSLAVVSPTLTSVSLDFIDEEGLRGKIPSPYNENFVRGLLQAETCVCDRPLKPGSHEWNAVQALLKNASNAELMGRVVRARSRIEVLKDARNDAPRQLQELERKLAALKSQQTDAERQLAEISKKLEAHPVAEIQEREQSRRELARRLEKDKERRIRLAVENENDEKLCKQLASDIAALSRKNEQARRLVLRRDVSLQLKDGLSALLAAYEEGARREIEAAVNSILEKTARRHYMMRIDESFELKLFFSNAKPAPKSSGENQLMSLAFIAALIQFAQKRTEEEDHDLLVPATVAPLVLDSPFGQLDDQYRTDTASFVPKMAPQVVLLVSSSQGKEEVMDALQDRIGAEYVLITENDGPRGEKRQDFLTVRGQRLATTLFNCKRNLTRIHKVA